MCLHHVSLLSRCLPKYSVSSAWGIVTPWSVTSRFRVKVTCSDLASFISSFHFLKKVWRLRRWICRLRDVNTDANIAVSSANVAISVTLVVGISAVYVRHNIGPGHFRVVHLTGFATRYCSHLAVLRGTVCQRRKIWESNIWCAANVAWVCKVVLLCTPYQKLDRYRAIPVFQC